MSGELGVADLIMFPAGFLVVSLAVDFDHETECVAIIIGDVAAQRTLTSDLQAVDLVSTEPLPADFLWR